MIVVRAPMQISFTSGITHVISAAIDKYVYVVINRTPFIPKISARYKISETVENVDDLKHTRIKTALKHYGIKKGIEIASFASLPGKMGLGSSSSFSVALLKGLQAYLGKKLSAHEVAESAPMLKIKQDQYSASFGGLNIIEFNANKSAIVKPVLIDYKKRLLFEKHLLLFYTGLTHDFAIVLKKQKIADSVYKFADYLIEGDYRKLGEILHKAWQANRKFIRTISSGTVSDLYQIGIKNGAWGGKILGGGECLLFIAPPAKIEQIKNKLKDGASRVKLIDYKEIPFRFVQSGAEILFNADYK